MQEAHGIPQALAGLLESDPAAGELFEHLSGAQRRALLRCGSAEDFGALLERAVRGQDGAVF